MASYSYLVDDVIAATENSSAEFLAYIPNMVNRAEERLVKDIDDYGLVSYVSVAVSANNNIVTLPTGTRVVKNFNIKDSGTKINLLLRTDEFLNDYWPVSASVGTPKYYAKRNNTTVLIAPTAQNTYNGQVVLVARPTVLSSVSETNYFTDFCYDILFYATMIEAALFQKDFQLAQLYEQKYGQLVDLQRNQARRSRTDDMQSPAAPNGGDTTLSQTSQ
jgi:hypothetical protein